MAAAGKGGAGVAAVEKARDGREGVFASLPVQMGGANQRADVGLLLCTRGEGGHAVANEAATQNCAISHVFKD